MSQSPLSIFWSSIGRYIDVPELRAYICPTSDGSLENAASDKIFGKHREVREVLFNPDGTITHFEKGDMLKGL